MRALTYEKIARLPVYACAGLILFLFLANLWNAAVERDWPKLRLRSAAPLAGVAAPQPAPWSLADFLSGETQKTVSINIGRLSPVFPISVRAKNQFVYSLFGSSAAPGVVVGQKGELYEQPYVDAYCAHSPAPNTREIDAWAASLRAMQDALTRDGRRFVYLVSPSKAARVPQNLPRDAACAAATPAQLRLAPYIAAMQSAGVTFVDGAGLMTEKRAASAMPLFPRGGTHWNTLGAALALQEALRLAPGAMGDLQFDWRAAPQAVGTDRDLVDLLNLLSPDVSYPTPLVTRTGGAATCAKTPRLVAIGSSFLHELLVAATQAPCPPQSDYWFYMRMPDNGVELGHFLRAPGDAQNGERRPATDAALDDDVRQADLVVLEENESVIGATKQFRAMREAAARWR